MTDVILSEIEARIVAEVGTERRISSLLAGGRDRPGIDPAAVWGIDVEGAGAELAFAKVMGWYWDGAVGTFHHRADVRHVHVRSSPAHHHRLIIRPNLDVPGIYVLVTGMVPRYRVHGWARWPGCPTTEQTPDPRRGPCLLVEQIDLRPLSALPMAEEAAS